MGRVSAEKKGLNGKQWCCVRERGRKRLGCGRVPFPFSPARYLSFSTCARLLQEIAYPGREKERREGDMCKQAHIGSLTSYMVIERWGILCDKAE